MEERRIADGLALSTVASPGVASKEVTTQGNNGASTRQGRRGGQAFCTSLCISCRRPGEDGRKQSAWESGPPVQSSFHAGIPSAPIASGKVLGRILDTKDVRKTYFHLPHQRVEVEVQ